MSKEMNLKDLKKYLEMIGELIGNTKVLDCISNIVNKKQYITISSYSKIPEIVLPLDLYKVDTERNIVLEICKDNNKYKITLLTNNDIDWLC